MANRSNALINYQKYSQNLLYQSFTLPFTPFSTYEPCTNPLHSNQNTVKIMLPHINSHICQSIFESGFFRIKLIADGKDQSGRKVHTISTIAADKGDPGYTQSAKMATEAAVVLASNAEKLRLTPDVAFEAILPTRLVEKGIKIESHVE